jgi:hypothetical protein
MHNNCDSAPSRWVGVGRSGNPDAEAAACACLAGALAGRTDAQLLVVFASDTYTLDTLIPALHRGSGATPLIGCSTSGEIAASGPGDSSVVLIAFGGDFSVATACAEDASDDLRVAGADAAQAIHRIDERDHTVMMLLTDALAGDQQDIVRGAYGELGAAVPIVGGCAGDDLKMTRTYQFHGSRVVTNAVVSAAISSDGPFGIGVRHGWTTVGDSMLVTRSDRNIVYEIDGRPAMDVYFERLSPPAEAATDPFVFTRFTLEHPLGIARRAGEPIVRFITELDADNGALVCMATVPEGAYVWTLSGDERSVLDATDAACAEALAPLTDEPLAMIAFDCIARRSVLGEVGIRCEIDRIADQASGAAVAGFYTYGEIARTHGVNGFHNETLVVLAVG